MDRPYGLALESGGSQTFQDDNTLEQQWRNVIVWTGMAWRCSQLLLVPVQLVLLVSGVSGSTVISEEFHRLVGQSLSVQCQYEPEEGPYVLKTWCRQTSPHRCTRVITTSEPRKAVRELQHTIWDDPEAGFFSINMTQLTEADSAFYWCGPFHASHRKVTVLRNISLVVSPGLINSSFTDDCLIPESTASSTLPSQTTAWIPESTDLTTSLEEITESSINGSEHRKSKFFLSWLDLPGASGLCAIWTPPAQGPDAVSFLCVPLLAAWPDHDAELSAPSLAPCLPARSPVSLRRQ
ncbi:Trem-like transcript 4 protein [Apodemus speciosus]|uniref:Trem-like transcript 4 protein n=1 Tax=Apodemus speciosus TaxID=105296 RepID=A0ABQ0FPM8_APOSI